MAFLSTREAAAAQIAAAARAPSTKPPKAWQYCLVAHPRSAVTAPTHAADERGDVTQ